MTREEIKDFCDMKAQLEPEDEDIFKAIVKMLEQEPTTKNDLGVDCISRFEVTEILNSEYDIDKMLDRVDELPSVTPQEHRWIPINERLPEDRRSVLVTAYWHETYQVMMASYYGDGLWWCVPFNNCGEHMQRLNPKAWMPLPEPYKAESEG